MEAVKDYIIVKLVYEKSIGNIIVPDTAKQYNGDFFGEVISIGKDYSDNSLNVGDKVLFVRHEGYKLDNLKDNILCLKSKWVLAKIEE